MGTDSLLETLSQIPVGTVIAIIVVLCAAIGGIVTGVVKAYQLFTKVKEKKDEMQDLKDTVERIETEQKETQDDVKDIINILHKQNEHERIKLRHSIVRAGEEAIANGKITIRQLRALHEMYDIYHQPDDNGVCGNGYVATLLQKVDALPVEGKLDENDNDIV